MPSSKKEDKDTDPRHVAREEELARQQEVADAVAKSNEEATKEARARLKAQQNIETFGPS